MYIEQQLPERRLPKTLVVRPKFTKPSLPISFFLAFKEIWRYRGRYLLISLVIALITTLVLFIAGLAEGLGAGNREYLDKLNADVILYQANIDLSIPSSRIDRTRVNDVQRVEGVKEVGTISFSNAAIPLDDGSAPLKVSLIGVEPGKPGEPPAFEGQNLKGKRDNAAIIDKNTALRTGLQVGDVFNIKTVQGTEEKLYPLSVAGISDGRQYSIQPSVFVPYLTWDDIKPKSTVDNNPLAPIFNLMAVQLENPQDFDLMVTRLENQIGEVEAVDRKTAYESTPGYSAQQSTLNTQRFFTLLIGVLVVGGFFQIQTLQKVAQVGMLKAIGTSNLAVAISFLLQIITITTLGVIIGVAGTLLLALTFPVTIPIIFTPASVITAITSLMLIGPLGGLVSVRILVKVEPLTALGLAS
jgi:putative ABC transport system permease protein